jgi:lipoate-protein ligase B
MNITPFLSIDTCGNKAMEVTQMCDLVKSPDNYELMHRLVSLLLIRFAYKEEV